MTSSARYWTQLFSGRSCPRVIVPKYHPTGWLPSAHPLYVPRKEEMPFVNDRLDTVALCLVEGLGVQHDVVGALSALEPSDP